MNVVAVEPVEIGFPRTSAGVEADLRAHYRAVRQRLGHGMCVKPVLLAPRAIPPVIPTTHNNRQQFNAKAAAVSSYKHCKHWLEDAAKNNQDAIVRRPTIREIVEMVCDAYGVSLFDLKSQNRHGFIIRPRIVAYWLCKIVGKKSSPEIGRYLGGRDHTTALSGVNRVERLRREDADFEAETDGLVALLRGTADQPGEAI